MPRFTRKRHATSRSNYPRAYLRALSTSHLSPRAERVTTSPTKPARGQGHSVVCPPATLFELALELRLRQTGQIVSTRQTRLALEAMNFTQIKMAGTCCLAIAKGPSLSRRIPRDKDIAPPKHHACLGLHAVTLRKELCGGKMRASRFANPSYAGRIQFQLINPGRTRPPSLPPTEHQIVRKSASRQSILPDGQHHRANLHEQDAEEYVGLPRSQVGQARVHDPYLALFR